jgi:CheY-like chemotaxis protein
VRSALGKGTTAILLLPLQRAETNRLRPESADLKPRTPQFALSSFMQSSSLSPPHSHNIRVLLVDDHAMVRQGLRSILEWYTDVEVVGEASDGEEAIASVAQCQPAVVVMDINMPKKNGIEATAEIMARWPHTTVIGLSVNATDDNRVAMARAGAALLLTKEAAVEELYRAMQQVLRSPAQN